MRAYIVRVYVRARVCACVCICFHNFGAFVHLLCTPFRVSLLACGARSLGVSIELRGLDLIALVYSDLGFIKLPVP